MNMSFALTTPQVLAGTKDVTRRLGWKNLKPGTVLQPVEKCQGIPKGGHVVAIPRRLRVVSVRREPLRAMSAAPDTYGAEECRREGFPHLTPGGFVSMFCAANRCEDTVLVTRIEFEYVP